MRKIGTFLILTTIAFSILSCKGEKGDTGNANVKSIIFDVNPSSWQGDTNGYATTLEIPEITENVYKSGAVLVYMLNNEKSSNKSFNKLPYTWIDNTNTEYMDYTAYVGKLEITLRWVDEKKNNTQKPSNIYTYKVMIIEGTLLSTLQKKVDVNNYKEVISYLSHEEE
jgi:hypothetical protein